MQLFAGVREDRVVCCREGANTRFSGNAQALVGLQCELFGNLLGAINGQAPGHKIFGKGRSRDDIQREGGLVADAHVPRLPQSAALMGSFHLDVRNFAARTWEQVVNGVARIIASACVKIIQCVNERAV